MKLLRADLYCLDLDNHPLAYPGAGLTGPNAHFCRRGHVRLRRRVLEALGAMACWNK